MGLSDRPPVRAETEAAAECLLDRVRSEATTTKVVQLQTRAGLLDVELRLLSGGEKQACVAAATRWFESIGMPVALRHYTDLDDEIAWQMVYAFAFEPVSKRRIGRTVEMVRANLSNEQRDTLCDHYMDFEDEVSPSIERLSEATIDAISKIAKKKSLEERVEGLTAFGSRVLRIYIATLESLPETSET